MKHLRILIMVAMLVSPAVTFAWELTNPGADKLIGWDNSAPAGSQTTWFGAGTGLEFNGTDIQVKLGTTASTVSEGNHGHSGVYELVGVAAGLDHAAITLDADAAIIFDLSTQEIGLDVQTANTVLAGPTTGEANEPTFRALVAGDIPDISATYQPADADLSTASNATGAGNSKYFGTSDDGTVGFHTLPDADLGFDVDAPGASGGVLQSNGTKWERKDSYGSVEIGGLTASMAVHSTASGILASHADVSSTELGYLNNVTSAIQTQLDTKAPKIVTEVDGHTDATNLTAAQVSSTIIYNTGQADSAVTLNLPTAAAGYNALFTVGTARAQKWRVKAGADDKIYLIAAAGTVTAGDNAGYATLANAQIGQSFACWTFKTDAYDWMCKAISIGTSTFAAEAAP